RDESALIAHLRELDAPHLQTLTIPQLSRDGIREDGRKEVFGFRKKKKPVAVGGGCDPAKFADEIVTQLAHIVDIRSSRKKKKSKIKVVEPPPAVVVEAPVESPAEAPAEMLSLPEPHANVPVDPELESTVASLRQWSLTAHESVEPTTPAFEAEA